MRYRDFARPVARSRSTATDRIVLLHVRPGEMPILEALVSQMGLRLRSPERVVTMGGVSVEVACPDAATARALRSRWSTAA